MRLLRFSLLGFSLSLICAIYSETSPCPLATSRFPRRHDSSDPSALLELRIVAARTASQRFPHGDWLRCPTPLARQDSQTAAGRVDSAVLSPFLLSGEPAGDMMGCHG